MATNTVPTFTNHTGNGTAGPFNIGFNYIDKNEIIVRVNEVLKSTPTHYTFNSNTQITFTSGNEPASGLNIELRRSTNITTAKVDFQDGSVLTETDLDANTNQLLFALQENTDAVNADNLESSSIYLRDGSRTLTGNIVFEGSTKDAHETTLTPVDPTADRTINIPNVSGTLVTTGDTGTVTSTMIANGTIVNADINSSAAIAGTKISPIFGSQNISTTGNVTASSFIGDGSQLTGITFTGIDQFLRRDIDDTASGTITFNKNIKIPQSSDDDDNPAYIHGNASSRADLPDYGNIIWNYPTDTSVYDPMLLSAWINFRTFSYFGSSIVNPELALNVGTATGASSSNTNNNPQFTITTGGSAHCVRFDKDGTNITNYPLRVHNSSGVQWEFRNNSPSLQIKCTDAFGSNPDSYIINRRGTLYIDVNHDVEFTDAGLATNDGGTNLFTSTQLKIKSYHDSDDESDLSGNDYYNGGHVEIYSNNTKRFETDIFGCVVHSNLRIPSKSSNASTDWNYQIFNSNSVNDNGYLIFGDKPDRTATSPADPMEKNNFLYHEYSTANETSTTTFQLGAVASSQVPLGIFKIIGNDEHIVTFSKNGLDLPDNSKLQLGTGQDLQVYWDGSSGFVTNQGGGNLHLNSDSLLLKNAANTESYIRAYNNNAVELYYNNGKKFETTSTGVLITGHLNLPDHVSGTGKIKLGDDSDLQIYHDGTDSFIDNSTGGLKILGDTIRLKGKSADENMIVAAVNGAAELYYNGNKKFETTDTGVTVTGDTTLSGDLKLPDNANLYLGSGDDLRIYHNGSNSYINNKVGNLYIQSNTDGDVGGDIHIRAKEGESSIACLDDGAVKLYYDNGLKFETTSTGTQASGNSHLFQGDGSPHLRVATTAVSSSTAKLTIEGSRTASTSTAISKIDFTTADSANTSVYNNTMPMGSIQMYKQQSNTNTGRLKIDLNNVSGDNLANVFDLESDGDLSITGTLTESSDRRLKTDIVTITDALTKVNNLRGVEYTKIASGKKEIGVIAQEVETVFPELVRTGDDEDKTLSVKYGHLTAALIEAVKELSAKVKVLESNI